MGHAPNPRSSKISFGIGELDGPGQLEAVAPDQLDGGGHSANEVVLLEAEDPHATPGHDGRRRQPVVAGADDDGVIVRHGVSTDTGSPSSSTTNWRSGASAGIRCRSPVVSRAMTAAPNGAYWTM